MTFEEIMKHYHFLSLSEISLSLEPPCNTASCPASCTLKRLWIALTQIQARCPKRSLAAAALLTIKSRPLFSETRHWISSQRSSPAFLIAPAWENVSENHQLSNPTSRTIGNKNKTIFLILSQESLEVVYFVAMNMSTFF